MEVKKLEELYNSSQGLQSLEEKRNRCAKELKWAYVKEIEQVAKHVCACVCLSVCTCAYRC